LIEWTYGLRFLRKKRMLAIRKLRLVIPEETLRRAKKGHGLLLMVAVLWFNAERLVHPIGATK